MNIPSRANGDAEQHSEELLSQRYCKLVEEQLLSLDTSQRLLKELELEMKAHSDSLHERYQDPINAVRARFEECATNIQTMKSPRFGRPFCGSIKHESAVPNRKLQKRRSESLEKETQTARETSLPFSPKRRRLERQGLSSVEEEAAVPSVELDIKLERATISTSWNNVHYQPKAEPASESRLSHKEKILATTPNISTYRKIESPFPSHVKSEFTGLQGPDGVFVKTETPELPIGPKRETQQVEIEYEDISAEVEARLKANAERRRNRGKAVTKPASKRKRDMGSGDNNGRESKRESFGRAAKMARVGASGGGRMGITA